MAKKGGSKQKKMNSRVDFTPMVDMIMLLVTFFMLCTTLLKPQTMEITMPSDKEDLQDEQRNQAKASEAITILIGEDNTLYYFEGTPENAKLVKTTYGKNGIRAFRLIRDDTLCFRRVFFGGKNKENATCPACRVSFNGILYFLFFTCVPTYVRLTFFLFGHNVFYSDRFDFDIVFFTEEAHHNAVIIV